MWNRKEVKSSTRKNMKLNYWACIAVCFLMAFFSIEYTASNTFMDEKADVGLGDKTTTSQEQGSTVKGSVMADKAIKKSAEKIKDEKIQKATSGVMASLANGITQASSTLSFIADAVYKAISKSSVATILVAVLGIALSLAFYMFFKAQLIIGERRFFLENRLYHDTRATRIFGMYSTKGVWNVAVIMFFKQLFFYLWCLTIVGGFIKLYEYRSIPFILAENPEISRKDCFALSKKMAYGHKMDMFKYDISFAGWFVLGVLTIGLVPVFYSNSYFRGGHAEIHAALRANAKAENFEHVELLQDEDLFTHAGKTLMADVYPTVKVREKHELSVPWNRKYSIVHIGLIFFAFAMIGWCWEVFYHFIKDGDLVNRGSLWGPWLPIYGIGGACVVVFLKPLGKKPALMAACTFVACGIIEYITAWYFETFKNIKYWDYSKFLFNIDGRVCLEGLIMFTVLASLGLYIIAPRFDDLFKKWPNKLKVPLLCVLAAAFVGDLIFTHYHPHTGKGISSSYVDTTDEYDAIEEYVSVKKNNIITKRLT